MSALEDKIAAILEPLGGRTAVAARHAGRPAPRALPVAGHNGDDHDGHSARGSGAPPLDVALRVDEVFPAAGLAALPIAIELMRRVDMGQFDLDERVDAASLTLGELCSHMLTTSDSAAANNLLDLVGMGEVNETMSRLNLPRTRLARHFLDFAARAAHRDNLTTAAETLTLLELIRGNALPGGRRLRETLAAQQSFGKLDREWLPAGAALAHKDGTLADTAHDAGILSGPNGAGVYVILTTEQPDRSAARAAIGRAVHALWDGWALG